MRLWGKEKTRSCRLQDETNTKICQPLLLLEKLGIFPHIYSTIINDVSSP